MHNDEDKTIDKIKESLDFLDSSVKVERPDLMKFVDLVNRTEEKKEGGKNRQFIIFVLTAVFIITTETYSFYRSFAFFAAVQAAALICVLPAIIFWVRSKNRQVTH